MSLFTDAITNDLKSIECDMDNPSISWNGNNYVCIPEDFFTTEQKNVSVGFDNNTEFTIKIRLDQFNGVFPKDGDTVIYQNVSMNIKKIGKPSHNKFWVLVLETLKMGYRN